MRQRLNNLKCKKKNRLKRMKSKLNKKQFFRMKGKITKDVVEDKCGRRKYKKKWLNLSIKEYNHFCPILPKWWNRKFKRKSKNQSKTNLRKIW